MAALVKYAGERDTGEPEASSTKARGVSREDAPVAKHDAYSLRLTPRASRREARGYGCVHGKSRHPAELPLGDVRRLVLTRPSRPNALGHVQEREARGYPYR
jgi:hypothetical protein